MFGGKECFLSFSFRSQNRDTVELQWLEQLLNYENMFETGVGRAKEC